MNSRNVTFRLFGALLLLIGAYGDIHAHGHEASDNPARPGYNAIASAHPAATEAGREVLDRGGNAFDAAVAVAAALAVVEPYSSGIGGGGFFLLHNASTGTNQFLDAREAAPGAATHDMYLDDQGEFVRERSLNGPLAAGIPGLPAALVVLARDFGRCPRGG